MHELGVVRSIVDIVASSAQRAGARRVNSVSLVVGKTRNLERYWVQEYFDRCAKGTLAEGATVEIRYVPVVFECRKCGERFGYRHAHMGATHCERCGADSARLISGTELAIESIEVE